MSSSEGIGASSALECRSERISVRQPRAIASLDLDAEFVEARLQRVPAALDVVEAAHDVGVEVGHRAVAVDPHQLGQLVGVEDRVADHDLAAGVLAGKQQVALGAEGGGQRGDQFLADRVQRRVRDLGEQLREVVEQQPRLVRQHRNRGVGTHRADRLRAGVGHRREDHPQLFVAVAEDLLAPGHRGVAVHDVLLLGQVVEVDAALGEPFRVRVLRGELGLDLVVVDQPVLVAGRPAACGRASCGPS